METTANATTMEEIAGITMEEFRRLAARDSTLILDTRPFMSYNEGHVARSVNVHCPPILKRRSGGFVALENIVPCPEKREKLTSGHYTTVVAYDQDTEVLASAAKDSNLYSVLKSLKQQVTGPEVLYITGGYNDVSRLLPDLLADSSPSPFTLCQTLPPSASPHATAVSQTEPVEILPHLLLGNGHHASQRELLLSLGVTSVLNVSTTCDNHFPADFRYKTIPVNDNQSADLASYFPEANKFIDSALDEGGKVLVHCHAGVSRSASVCLAYLMTSQRMRLDTAYEHVQSRRSVIAPNLNFMRQLQELERELFGGEGSQPPQQGALLVPTTATPFLDKLDSGFGPPSSSSSSADAPPGDKCFSFASFDFPFPGAAYTQPQPVSQFS